MLFSLRTAYVLLVFLAVVFGVGNVLSGMTAASAVFKEMNETHFFGLWNSYTAHPLVLVWLCLLVFLGVFLFLNTLCCTFTQVVRYREKKLKNSLGDKRNRGMMIIHLITIVVIAFHAIDLALIARTKPQQILVGESAQLGPYTITAKSLDYVTDRTAISQTRKGQKIRSTQISSDEFSISGNRVELSISRAGVVVRQGFLTMLHPLRYGGTFFILDGFIVPYGSESGAVAALVHHTYNPLVIPFFMVYALLLFFLVLQILQQRYRPLRSTEKRCAEAL